MKEYTPINEWKLSRNGREIFKKCQEILTYEVENVHLNTNEFNELLLGISPSLRQTYIDNIPLCGKIVVRK